MPARTIPELYSQPRLPIPDGSGQRDSTESARRTARGRPVAWRAGVAAGFGISAGEAALAKDASGRSAKATTVAAAKPRDAPVTMRGPRPAPAVPIRAPDTFAR